MSYSVLITEQAGKDLRCIFKYIAHELKSPDTASAQLDRIEKAVMSLDTMPYRFKVYDEEPWHSRGLRIMPVDNYIVFYIPDDSDSIVTIVRVMYGGRNIERQLNADINFLE